MTKDGGRGERASESGFALPAGVDWIPVDAALAVLEQRLRPVAEVERVALAAAAERILAAPALALRNHPPADNAAVDGYAFAHPGETAGAQPLDLALHQTRAAAGARWEGGDDVVIAPGVAVRILTGALMPPGTDTVVLQEDVTVTAPPRPEGAGAHAAGLARVRFTCPRRVGANRRRRGETVAVGASLAEAGERLSPQRLAQLAAGGVAEVNVYKPLKVAVLSTGDELADAPGPDDARGAARALAALGPETVLDANRPMLAALLRRLGVEVVDLGIARDSAAAVAAALDAGAAEAQAIITSGGASSGDEDHLARALERASEADPESAAFHQWRIAMKPGRPLAMGLWRGRPVFGLPGNPVAAFVCFVLFARPSLLRLAGAPWTPPKRRRAVVDFDYPKKPGRREFLRARYGTDGRLEKFRSEGSGLIEGLLWSDGLVDLDHGRGPLSRGETVDFLDFADLGA